MTGMLGGIVERWGPVLFTIGLVYSIIASIVVLSYEAGGAQPTIRLVPSIVADAYRTALQAWQSVASHLGRSYGIAELALVSWDLFKASVTSMLAIVGFFETAATAFIIIALNVSELLPAPFMVVKMVVWVLAAVAETVLLFYIYEKVYNIATQIIQMAISVFSRLTAAL